MSDAAPPTFIDTHAHLDDPAFDVDRSAVIAAARAARVERIVNVGYNPERWPTTVALAAASPTILVVLGLHPHQADAYSDAVGDALEAAIAAGGARAVGEIGIDLFRPTVDLETQQHAFREQIGLAARLRLPIVVHQRAAEAPLIDILEKAPAPPAVLLHSFDGTARLTRFALDRGYLLGVGGLATRASAGALRGLLQSVPVDRIVLETDAPYLLPAGIRGRRNEPAHVAAIASLLSPLWGLTLDDFAAQTTRTARRFFGIADDGTDLSADPTG